MPLNSSSLSEIHRCCQRLGSAGRPKRRPACRGRCHDGIDVLPRANWPGSALVTNITAEKMRDVWLPPRAT